MQPKVVMNDRRDGSGFTLGPAYGGHHGHLAIGNVSIAFDDRNDYREKDVSGICVQLSELRDDPVRLNNISVHDIYDPADKLLFALAADRGYRLEKIESEESDESAVSSD